MNSPLRCSGVIIVLLKCAGTEKSGGEVERQKYYGCFEQKRCCKNAQKIVKFFKEMNKLLTIL